MFGSTFVPIILVIFFCTSISSRQLWFGQLLLKHFFFSSEVCYFIPSWYVAMWKYPYEHNISIPRLLHLPYLWIIAIFNKNLFSVNSSLNYFCEKYIEMPLNLFLVWKNKVNKSVWFIYFTDSFTWLNRRFESTWCLYEEDIERRRADGPPCEWKWKLGVLVTLLVLYGTLIISTQGPWSSDCRSVIIY